MGPAVNQHIHPPHRPIHRQQDRVAEQHIIGILHQRQGREQRLRHGIGLGIVKPPLLLVRLAQLLIIQLVLHGTKAAAVENILSDHVRHIVISAAFKPNLQGAADIAIEIPHLQLVHDLLHPSLIQLIGLTVDIQIDEVPQANAPDPEMLGHMAENIGKFVLPAHVVAVALAFYGHLPARAEVIAEYGLRGGIEPAVQLQVQLGNLPNEVIDRLLHLLIRHGFHDGYDPLILIQSDQHIGIAHGAHLRLGVQTLQGHTLQEHIVDPLRLEGVAKPLHRLHLPVAGDQVTEIVDLHLLHQLRLRRDAAIDGAGINQGDQRMALDQRRGLFQFKPLR